MAKRKSKFGIASANHVGLSLKDKGKEVKELQSFLEDFGYFAGAIGLVVGGPMAAVAAKAFAEGVFDEPTRKALALYQSRHGLTASGVFDSATAAAMSRPRCGNPDVPPAAGVFSANFTGSRWPSTSLRYRYREKSTQLPHTHVQSAIQAAFEIWAEHTPLTFTEVEEEPAEIEIRFVPNHHGDNVPFDRPGPNVLAHAFFPGTPGKLAGDVHFDEREDWTVLLPTTGIDLVTVAAHEIGHALGLDHSTIPGTLMLDSYHGPMWHLAPNDIARIQTLYGTP